MCGGNALSVSILVDKHMLFMFLPNRTLNFLPYSIFFHKPYIVLQQLFQPEEIELLVRGSAEPLQIEQLRTVTVYEGFREDEETIRNFWILFKEINPLMQRKLLTFVTGTDRIPATGVENLAFKITCIGEDSERFVYIKRLRCTE